mmetsp:Transcript_17733/g.46295  ORF Transcript_17733/g.46295 Transcript_17733/m.46295 type:complete len:361 (+) Transcript_17733:339-1421(+)
MRPPARPFANLLTSTSSRGTRSTARTLSRQRRCARCSSTQPKWFSCGRPRQTATRLRKTASQCCGATLPMYSGRALPLVGVGSSNSGHRRRPSYNTLRASRGRSTPQRSRRKWRRGTCARWQRPSPPRFSHPSTRPRSYSSTCSRGQCCRARLCRCSITWSIPTTCTRRWSISWTTRSPQRTVQAPPTATVTSGMLRVMSQTPRTQAPPNPAQPRATWAASRARCCCRREAGPPLPPARTRPMGRTAPPLPVATPTLPPGRMAFWTKVSLKGGRHRALQARPKKSGRIGTSRLRGLPSYCTRTRPRPASSVRCASRYGPAFSQWMRLVTAEFSASQLGPRATTSGRRMLRTVNDGSRRLI